MGKDPFLIEDHWTVMYRAGFYRGGGVHMSAIGGIDQALWDIKGKAINVPVHQLLGGQLRDRIRVYSWIGGDRPAETATLAQECGARGFTASRHGVLAGQRGVARLAVLCVGGVQSAQRVLVASTVVPSPL